MPEEVATVAPFLAQLPEVEHWEIAPETGEHILRVSVTDIDPQRVKNAVKAAGFHAELLRIQGTGGADL